MQDAVIGVLDAARAALNGTSTAEAAEKAMAPFRQRYDNASDAISSTFGAAPTPPASSREGLDGAAAEMQDLVRNLVVDKTAEGQLFGSPRTSLRPWRSYLYEPACGRSLR